MTPNQKCLAAELLRKASDEFANHGCNDFRKPRYMEPKEWQALVHDMQTRQEGADRPGEPVNAVQADWCLMSYLAELLEDEAELDEERALADGADAPKTAPTEVDT